MKRLSITKSLTLVVAIQFLSACWNLNFGKLDFLPATSSFTLDIDPQFVEVPGTVYTWTIPAIPQPIVAYNPPPVVVSQAGILTVNITSVDLQGLITSHDQQVTITEPAFPFTIVEQNGLTITVQTLFPLVPMFDYFLSFDGGITNIALPPNGILNITVPDFGTYDLSLTVYNELSFQIGPITWLPVDILEFCTSPLIPNFAFSISDTVSCGGITTLSASLVLNGDESDYCMDIDWGDGSASSINYTALFGLWTIHFYDCEGTYEVEVIIRCCDYPNSFAYKTNHVITVVCDCQLPTASSIDIITSTGLDDPCNVITACIEPISDPSSLADTDLCVIYDWGDGSSPENAYPGQCPSHNYNCNGTYTITASVFCCGNICESFIIEKEVVVNCACNIEELDAVTWIVSTEDCTINGSFLLGQCFDGKCLNWDWGDESATEEMTASEDGNAFSHTYGASGTYMVEVTAYCCDNPSSYKKFYLEISVTCPCTFSALESFPYSGINVIVEEDPLCMIALGSVSYPDDIDESQYCVRWFWGDGSEPTLAGLHETAVHSYEQNGEYNVCARILCCDQPLLSVIMECSSIAIDCSSPYMASCQVFPSFYILSSGEEGWNIYPTTQVNPFTELFTQEIIITDQFDLPVYQYGWTSLDWFAPLNIPALGPGDYTITMNASGFLGAPGCYATYSLPYTVETMCPGDLDGNLTVNTADLLLLMSTFGDVCGQ